MRRPSLALLALLPLVLGCGLFPRFGGFYESEGPVDLGSGHTSVVRLILGQYGSEAAGHLAFPDQPDCPCLYVAGDAEEDELRIESDPLDSPQCTLVLTGVFEETSIGLRGSLYLGSSTLTPWTQPFELTLRRGQQELSADDLRGCP